ncbi:MAG: hypothetical protein JWP59_414, partial [Massilia sp.]|nr:hypothetical protein [Massilia sp.]
LRYDKAVLFAGPSTFGLPDELLGQSGMIVYPPAKRGDIAALTGSGTEPCTLILADGIFHSELAVGHVELRDAITQGWDVWGVSSMGAIRASEMHHLGMRGYGRVFELFAADVDFSDDEVALLHAPMQPYFPITEPLVHTRFLLDHLQGSDLLDGDAAVAIIASLKARWFGFRTPELLEKLLGEVGGLDLPACKSALQQQAQFRIKNQDLRNLLLERIASLPGVREAA